MEIVKFEYSSQDVSIVFEMDVEAKPSWVAQLGMFVKFLRSQGYVFDDDDIAIVGGPMFVSDQDWQGLVLTKKDDGTYVKE